MTANTLIGTWRVLSFTRWNKDGVASQPLGLEPAGCAVFDATGHAVIQLGRSATDGGFPDEVAKSTMCYFGPYTISGDTVKVTVEGSNMADYLGSVQSGTSLSPAIPRPSARPASTRRSCSGFCERECRGSIVGDCDKPGNVLIDSSLQGAAFKSSAGWFSPRHTLSSSFCRSR